MRTELRQLPAPPPLHPAVMPSRADSTPLPRRLVLSVDYSVVRSSPTCGSPWVLERGTHHVSIRPATRNLVLRRNCPARRRDRSCVGMTRFPQAALGRTTTILDILMASGIGGIALEAVMICPRWLVTDYESPNEPRGCMARSGRSAS